MKVICIEGIDAVGKETVSKALGDRLVEMGYRVHRASFPIYEEATGQCIREALNGNFGDPVELDPELFGPLYTLNRIKYFRNQFYSPKHGRDVDYLILDRSFYSNFMYQCSKYYSDIDDLEGSLDVVSLKKMYDWLMQNYVWEIHQTALCYARDIHTFVLELSEEDSLKQLGNRVLKDQHETNRKYLNNCKAFVACMTDCNNIRKIQDIFHDFFMDDLRPEFPEMMRHYFYNVHRTIAVHADNAEDIPKATSATVDKILRKLGIVSREEVLM